MSCTVVAVPFALTSLLGPIVIAAITGAVSTAQMVNDINEINTVNPEIKEMEDRFFEEVQHIQMCNLVEKEFQTAFTDKSILLKTLEEHGISNMEEDLNGNINCTIENFNLNFYRNSEHEPYVIKIKCRETDNAENKVDDLNSEYTLNVQEDAYLNLLDRLKENNMEIENEVVEDDNTIVLTINLE